MVLPANMGPTMTWTSPPPATCVRTGADPDAGEVRGVEGSKEAMEGARKIAALTARAGKGEVGRRQRGARMPWRGHQAYGGVLYRL